MNNIETSSLILVTIVLMVLSSTCLASCSWNINGQGTIRYGKEDSVKDKIRPYDPTGIIKEEDMREALLFKYKAFQGNGALSETSMEIGSTRVCNKRPVNLSLKNDASLSIFSGFKCEKKNWEKCNPVLRVMGGVYGTARCNSKKYRSCGLFGTNRLETIAGFETEFYVDGGSVWNKAYVCKNGNTLKTKYTYSLSLGVKSGESISSNVGANFGKTVEESEAFTNNFGTVLAECYREIKGKNLVLANLKTHTETHMNGEFMVYGEAFSKVNGYNLCFVGSSDCSEPQLKMFTGGEDYDRIESFKRKCNELFQSVIHSN